MIFGIMDDDTKALWEIAVKNYNLTFVFTAVLLYMIAIYKLVSTFLFNIKPIHLSNFGLLKHITTFLFIAVLTFLAIRGSFGTFPIYHWTRDVTGNNFLNKVSKDSTYLLLQAYREYKKSKKGQRNYIKEMGYSGHIEDAFKLLSSKKEINSTNLYQAITYKTPSNLLLEKHPVNVVIIMVESFGTPILKYQSETFDIERRLKKHFQSDDIRFKNFISTANGTIVSMEPMLLNLIARPGSVPYGQSLFSGISFKQAGAKVYKKKGYETSYIYGGDLSWRNVGRFFPRQGFEHVEGKAKIEEELHLDPELATHDWGVYDKYLYNYIYKKLKNARKPQLIYAMTTNNHPPYVISKEYKSKKLILSKELKKHLKGDLDLIKKRLYDYQYALDMAGRFLDMIKSSPLAKNTVVVITADNNTIEGSMNYDNFLQESKQIPFYIYMPKSIKPKNIDLSTPGSHKDIFPTLYNLTLSDTSYIAVGSNLLDKNITHCGFNNSGIIVSREGAFMLNKPQNQEEQKCQQLYKASLAVTDYLVKTQLHQKDKK
ncbi:LTA synthase family protein [Sulfurimonas paralvinellae]|nr:LTA synthase family protein [Sulfurimonas paralvinellae]